jgi:fructose-1,6-bisphosphatase
MPNSQQRNHQRIPLFIGSEEDVKLAEEFLQGKR